MLNSNNPRIVNPIIDFFKEYLTANKNVKELDQSNPLFNQIGMIAQNTFKNMSYPEWFLEMGGHTPDPDDWSDGRLDE